MSLAVSNWAAATAALAALDKDGTWVPGIGDPSLMGWLTTLLYCTAAFLCLNAARSIRHGQGRWDRGCLFWSALFLLMLMLGVNKQLDLQTWFTQFGRQLARAEGMYAARRTLQVVFIGGIALSGLIAIAILGYLSWGKPRVFHWALIGVVFLLCFVVIRAASFHHVDRALGLRFLCLKVNWILEMGGILCVLVPASRVNQRAPARR